MGQKKTTAKVFKNGQESPSDATLNEPVPRLIRMLACDCQKKNILCPISLLRPASIALLSWSSYTKEFVYLKTRLLAVPVLLEQESFLREQFSVFQWKWAPKVYSISFIRSSCITYPKKISPTLAWQVCRAGDSAWTSLVVHRLNSLIGRFSFFLLTCYIRGKISVQPKHLLCMRVFILFISTICVK